MWSALRLFLRAQSLFCGKELVLCGLDALAFYVMRDTDPGCCYPRKADGSVDKFNDLPQAAKGNVNLSEVPYDSKPGESPRLNEEEIDQIVAFLRTLTDKPFEDHTQDPNARLVR